MENVKKRKQHTPPPRWLTALLIALLICALLAALVLLRPEDHTPTQPDANAVSDSVTLYQCEAENLHTLSITTPEKETYTLHHENGTLVFPDDPQFTLRDSIVSVIINNASHIIAEKTILNTDETIADLNDFGLKEPQCTALITYHDGTTHTLRVGNQMTFGIPYYYFMWDDDPCIYAVSTDVYEAFSYSVASLHAVTQPYWDSELWDRVSITGENTRIMERNDFGWQLTAPYHYPLSSAQTEAFFTNIENIHFAQYVGEAEDLPLSQYGLENPRLILTLDQAQSVVHFLDDTGNTVDETLLPAEKIVLKCGSMIDDYYFYAEYLGSIYTATQFQLGFLWNQQHEKLFETHPANIDLTLLESVELLHGHASTHFDIHLTEQLLANGDVRTDDNGHTLYSVQVLQNGVSVENDDFLLWYAQLRQLTPEGILDAITPVNTDPILSITLSGKNTKRQITFHPLDALYYQMAVDGTAYAYISKSAVEQLLP